MKILICTKNWVGDALFQMPAIEAIRERYPDAEIVCLTAGRCREIFEKHPAINRVMIFDEKNEHRFFLKRWLFALELRGERWDQAYLFHRSRTRAFMLMLAGVRERIGYDNGRRQLFLTKTVPEPLNIASMHQVDFFIRLVRASGIPAPQHPRYRFYFSEDDRKIAADLLEKNGLKNFVCFHLGANWEPKRWPPAHFARLADLISAKWGYDIAVTGGPGDMPLAEQMLKSVKRARVIPLIGRTSLGTLGALYQKAAFVVSGDSGPLHIASGVGARVVALFGPTSAVETGPRGIGERILITYVPEGYSAPWYGEPKVEWLSKIQPEDVAREIENKNWKSEFEEPASSALTGQQHEARALLVTLSNVGDVILTTPVISALHAKYPALKLTVVCGPRAAGVLSGSRLVDRLLIYDKHAGFGAQLKFLRELRRESYDVVVDLRNTAIPYLVSAKKRSPLFRRSRTESMRARHLEILDRMKLKAEGPVPAFDFFNAADEKRALEKIRAKGLSEDTGWIVVAPAAASELKTWKREGFADVLRRLTALTSDPILLVGDMRERTLAEPLTAIRPGRIMNIAGETTLRELAAIVSRCSLLLSNDSAVMHLGHELDRPVVAVFGPTSHLKYGRTGPRFRTVREDISCSPCGKPVCRFKHQACLEDLKAERVFETCRDLLIEKNTPIENAVVK